MTSNAAIDTISRLINDSTKEKPYRQYGIAPSVVHDRGCSDFVMTKINR